MRCMRDPALTCIGARWLRIRKPQLATSDLLAHVGMVTAVPVNIPELVLIYLAQIATGEKLWQHRIAAGVHTPGAG